MIEHNGERVYRIKIKRARARILSKAEIKANRQAITPISLKKQIQKVKNL